MTETAASLGPPGIAASGPIDVSVTIRPGMPIYAGDPGFAIELAKSIDRGDPANVSRLDLGAHTGTHVDAPQHFLPDGVGASELPLESFIGQCAVVDAHAVGGKIDGAAVGSLALPPRIERVLFKTSNSALWERDSFTPDFVSLNADGASALIERDIRLVGIDYLSIGDPEAHQLLLGSGIGVIEGLDLRRVDAGSYFLACLPLKIEGSDGAPARAVLWSLRI